VLVSITFVDSLVNYMRSFIVWWPLACTLLNRTFIESQNDQNHCTGTTGVDEGTTEEWSLQTFPKNG